MPPRLRSVIPHLAMLLISVLLYWAMLQIDTRGAESGRRIGPDFWPRAIIVIMGLLCVYEIVKRLVIGTAFTARGLTDELDRNPAESVAEPAPEPQYLGRLLGGIGLIAGFALAVDWLGFFVATALFLFLFMLVGGFRRPLLAALIATAGSFVMIVLFMRLAYISLPLGAGPFRELSIALLRLLGVD
ncbi:MAG: tripartite tricarboxylate transporter TctB family protein [Gammaproteobacteria bacterium]